MKEKKTGRQWLLLALLSPLLSWSQQKSYSLNMVHSHNDYWQKKPFYLAYEHGLGSVEADTYLWKGKLLVAHDTLSLKTENTLQHLYLDPIRKVIKAHGGHPFSDSSLTLQLLIELKSEPDSEIKFMEKIFSSYSDIMYNPKMAIVFTGNTPSEKTILQCPTYMQFDGQLSHHYTPNVLKHMGMLSDNLQDLITWNGEKPLTLDQKNILKKWILKGHELGKKVRFWNAPDNAVAWNEWMELGVDYINTDHIELIAQFFKQKKK